ncbi:SIMPL domain-containing protein [Gangjinia marincola]|uniref:SIMPL domain-containing protein n=1 Tax=Gangjinia marincola TaxID=578463 RepID=A0ABP3XRQ1_9FLAO
MKNLLVLPVICLTLITQAQTEMPPSIQVNGEGTVKVIPDQLQLSVSVEHEGNDAAEVKHLTDKDIDAVLKFLKKEGIPSKNIKTQYINLNKTYQYNTKQYVYRSSQSISVLLEDLKKYELIMTGLIDSGINRISGLNFKSSKQDQLEREARRKAILNAKQKADDLAMPLNQKVGRALQIVEGGSTMPGPQYRNMMLEADAMSFSKSGGNQQTISPGEMEIKVNVTVRFELK